MRVIFAVGVAVLLLLGAALFVFLQSTAEGERSRELDELTNVGARDRGRVVPIIRPLGGEEEGSRPEARRQNIHPAQLHLEVAGKELPPEQLPFSDFFVGNLSIRYVVDGERSMVNLTPTLLAQLGVTREELLRLGVENLHRRYPDAQVHRYESFGMVTGSGDLESSWMLDFGFWEKEARRFNGTLIASVPAREVMVWCDSADTELVADLRAKARDIAAKERSTNRAVSTLLYAWKSGGWEVYAP